jgi:hypothetical protein
MDTSKIKPDRITKPIQLLAVWMSGLLLLVSAFLTAAGTIKQPTWLPGFFGISAVCIIPVFLLLVFLLQTKFRPEMQEDTFYSGYLDTITKQKVKSSTTEPEYELLFAQMNAKLMQLSEQTKSNLEKISDQISKVNGSTTEIQQVKAIIRETDAKIDKAELSIIRARINDQLDNFQVITTELAEMGVTIDRSFGDPDDKPSIKLATIGLKLNPKTVAFLLSKLKGLGIMAINIAEGKRNENIIYIGSYGYKRGNIVPLTKELIDKLNQISNFAEFKDLIVET